MRAAIYTRQSLDKSGEGLAVDRQLSACRDLIEQAGWTEARVYSDNDASATSAKARPEWQALLVDLRAGRYDVLVCWHTDRLYRRLRDLVDLVELAEARPLRIATVQASDIDLSSPAGRMLAGMLGSASRYEIEQKGARQVAANRQRAERGVMLWTRRPFGFQREGHRVTVVPDEANIIREMARRVLARETLASIAADLEARGIPTSTGAPSWHVTTVRRVVTNPRVAGRVIYKGEDMGARGPQILDDDTFERVVALLTDPRRRTAPPSLSVKWLLSGLVRCGRDDEPMHADGVPMHATSNAKGQMIYRCQTCYAGRLLEPVDEVVVSTVCARLARPDAAALLAPDVDLDAIRAEVVELRGRRDGLAEMLAEGLLSPDAAKAQARKLTTRLQDAERELEAVTGASPLAAVVGAEDVRATFDALPIGHRRAIIDTLATVRILPVGKGARFRAEHVDIDWRTPA